jgi:hypothetical protein
MRTSHWTGPSVLLASLVLSGAVTSAQAPDQAAAQAIKQEIDQLKQDFDARMSALESRLAVCRTPARVSRHHRVDKPRPRFLVRLRAQRLGD